MGTCKYTDVSITRGYLQPILYMSLVQFTYFL